MAKSQRLYLSPDDPIIANRDKILIGGDFFASSASGDYYSPRFARLNADGSWFYFQTFIGEGR
jgi:hypothetical protein